MARPIHADANATRRDVLTSASRLFSERGLGQSSVREIAREAGVSLGTVHHYYGSKDDLYEACIDAMYAELEALRSELKPLFLSGAPSQDVLERVVKATFRFGRAHHPALRLVMREVLDTGEIRSDRRKRYLMPYLGDGTRLMQALTGGGLPDDIRWVLQSISHLVVRYSLTSARELAMVSGLIAEPGESSVLIEKEAVARVEAHLVGVSNMLLHAGLPRGDENDRG